MMPWSIEFFVFLEHPKLVLDRISYFPFSCGFGVNHLSMTQMYQPMKTRNTLEDFSILCMDILPIWEMQVWRNEQNFPKNTLILKLRTSWYWLYDWEIKTTGQTSRFKSPKIILVHKSKAEKNISIC